MNAVGDALDFLFSADNWTGDTGFLALGRAHLWISFVATVIAAAIAIPPAVWLAHRRAAPILSVAIVNIGRAVPSFAIIVFVFPLSIKYGFGLGFWPTCVALVAMGVPPIFTNAYVGISGAPPGAVEAAHAIGMTDRQVLSKVELPASFPLILTGLRVSIVQIVATATLGALVGYECLGTPIIQGLARGTAGRPQLLAAAIVVIILAVGIDALIGRLVPTLAPWSDRVR